MILNQYGEIMKHTWLDLPNHNENIFLDEYIIMPDHFHGIIKIIKPHGRIPNPPNNGWNSVPPQPYLSEIVRQLKSFSTRRINELRKTPGKRVWHRSYNDKIIWNDSQLENIRRYIRNNPKKWDDTSLK